MWTEQQASSKLKNQQQKVAEQRIAKERGEVGRANWCVRRVVLAFVIRFRAAMLSLEPRIGARLPHLSVDDRATIEAIIHETLREIVNTDPETVLADIAA